MKNVYILFTLGLILGACGKNDGSSTTLSSEDVSPKTNYGYACNFAEEIDYLVYQYDCFQVVTGEECVVLANAETGERLYSTCSEYQ